MKLTKKYLKQLINEIVEESEMYTPEKIIQILNELSESYVTDMRKTISQIEINSRSSLSTKAINTLNKGSLESFLKSNIQKDANAIQVIINQLSNQGR